jgi:hypothetical protein
MGSPTEVDRPQLLRALDTLKDLVAHDGKETLESMTHPANGECKKTFTVESDNPIRTSLDGHGLLLENTSHHLTDDVTRALAARRHMHAEMLTIAQETDRPPEIRREDSELRLRQANIAADSNRNIEALMADFRDAALKRNERISKTIKDRITRLERLKFTDRIKWSDLFVAPPVDHSFWWAQTQPHVAPDMSADFRNDGLHFWGGPKVNDYNGEMHTSFGAVALFALQPERFPTSPRGVFLSSPHVELFGGIVAYAPDWDLIQGNGIAECKLFLRQTIFQWRFGPEGSVAVTIAEAQGYDPWYVYLRNTGYSRNVGMPGFKLIPAVTYNQSQVAPNQLWAEIEVRFDIYLNCTGALVWCDPDVLLRTFQWAPTPLP